MSLRLKFAFDKLVACSLLVLLSPLLVVVALLIKRDGGPALFTQERLGHQSGTFSVYKFRTMIPNADDHLNNCGEARGMRITPVGYWLRKSSMDELPQLLNVLRGEMSLVGPRPILPDMLPYLTNAEKRRFNVRPGLTGLAQVRGRNDILWSERLRYDIEYVENYSLWLDVKILVKTAAMVVTGAGISIDRNSADVDDVRTRPITGTSERP